MASIGERIKHYFTAPLFPHVAFQMSSNYLSGISVSSPERNIKHHFISPLRENVIQPSFNKKNVLDEVYLEERIREGAAKLHLKKNKIACLIPESCCKIFTFSFQSLPSSRREREGIIRWQVKKQMPVLPNDIRLSFALLESNTHKKILVFLARASVIQEYEELFSRAGLRVRVVGTPTLSLHNLLAREKKHDVLVINIEEDYISLVVVVSGDIVLYRLKPLVLESSARLTLSQKMGYVITEVENTINFIQDKEKKRVGELLIRLALADPAGEALSILREKLGVPFKGFDAFLPSELTLREKLILAPLVGKVL